MNPNPNRGERVEGLVLVVILLLVAGFAGAASFTHVKDWTLDNSPTGTGAWFGWANAVISELVPVAALLTIRRRRRTGGPIGYPLFLLVAAVVLSLAAQLAVAKPSLSGWLLSAVPALAFMGLSKLILGTTPAPADEHSAQGHRPPRIAGGSTTDTGPATPVVTPTAPPSEPPAPSVEPMPPAAAPEPVALVPVQPTRPAPVAPVPTAAFVRHNGTPLTREVSR